MKLRQYHVSNKIAGYLACLILLLSVAYGQTTVIISPVPQLQFFDQSGRPLAFGCVFTYQSNSTTPLATYTDYTGGTANQNPVILSAGGSANIWIQAGVSYSFRVKSSGGVNCASGSTLYTVNGIGGGTSTLTTIVPYSPTPTFQIAAQNQLFLITLTSNASSQPLTAVGIIPPGIVTWQITQDASGGHTFTWPANSIGGATICSVANCVTQQSFIWNGTNATAIGPATYSIGPAMAVPSLYDFALSASSAICTDATQQLSTSCTSILGVTFNGQTVQPGAAGNVNVGAATHSLAINEGDGNAIAGVLLGASQIPIGVASADPTPSTLPTCSGGTTLTYSGTPPLTCIAPTTVLASTITTRSTDLAISQNVGTTVLTQAVTMPASGCPCRVLGSYGLFYDDGGNSGIATAWLKDGTNDFATSQVLNNDAGGVGPGGAASSMSPVTYANGASVTFTVIVNMTNSAGGTVKAAAAAGAQHSWMNIVVFTSN